MAKYGRQAATKVARAMRERSRGTLRSGGSGRRVTSRKQTIAIGLSEAREAGAKVPAPKKAQKEAPTKAQKKTAGRSQTRAPKKTSGKRAGKKAASRKTRRSSRTGSARTRTTAKRRGR